MSQCVLELVKAGGGTTVPEQAVRPCCSTARGANDLAASLAPAVEVGGQASELIRERRTNYRSERVSAVVLMMSW